VPHLSNADLDFVVDDADVELVDGEAGVVDPFAVVNAESPSVPGAGDGALFVQVSGTERRAHVGAEVVDREVAAVLMEHGDETFTDLERTAFALGDIADFGDRNEVIVGGVSC